MVSFTVTNSNNGLFSTQPAVSATGTLTYTLASNANGSATVSMVAKDSAGTANEITWLTMRLHTERILEFAKFGSMTSKLLRTLREYL